MLTEQTIEGYVSRLTTERGKPAGKDLKRKTRKALRGMLEILLANEHEKPDESDYAEYRESSLCEEESIEQDIKRIRRYFALKEEGREQLSMIPEEENTAGMIESVEDEAMSAPTEKKRTKGVKRVQVSVYLEPQTYETMKALSSITHESIGDMIAKAAKELAKKNETKANEILRVLQGFEMEY